MNVGPGAGRRIPERFEVERFRWRMQRAGKSKSGRARGYNSNTWQDTKQCRAAKRWRLCDIQRVQERKKVTTARVPNRWPTRPWLLRDARSNHLQEHTVTLRVSQAGPTQNSSSHNCSVMPILIHASQRAALLPQTSNLTFSRDFLPLVLDFSMLFPGILAVSSPKISSCSANCDIMFAHPASDCPSCLENPPPDPKSCHPHGPSRVLR